MTVNRDHWEEHIESVIRSRHYTWLPEGLGGEPVDSAMAYLVADIMHVCKLSGVSWDDILKQGHERFANEEAERGADEG